MRRILVPLDGTDEAATILPDARRVAGPDGQLILVRDTGVPVFRRVTAGGADLTDVEEVEQYLEQEARGLRRDGVEVETHAFVVLDPSFAICEAADVYDADMIACATHGRSMVGRLLRGGVAWKALSHSSVPVLLRRIEDRVRLEPIFAEPRRIMVPLDGSEYAEKAVPLAAEIASEWGAALHLIRVAQIPTPLRYPLYELPAETCDDSRREAEAYLVRVAQDLPGPVQCRVLLGGVVDDLIAVVKYQGITDVVMATHGRTGLSRVVLGSVADQLIHRLHVAIIAVPALAAEPAAAGVRPARDLVPST